MAHVVSVSISQEHTFSKYPVDAILLIQGEGIEATSIPMTRSRSVFLQSHIEHWNVCETQDRLSSATSDYA